ncbi:MAG: hypothetical protein P1V51_20540 [Deltaproteobacteria bacterium]|nr:hypothetical protein [Deltaproteobacteria bacterium]
MRPHHDLRSPRSSALAGQLALLLLPLLSLGASCGSPEVPEGTECAEVHSAGGSSALSRALEAAKPGDCVVLGNGTYEGHFKLPAGVTLIAGEDKLPLLQAEGTDDPVLQVEGGALSRVVGLEIVATGGQGIDVREGPASLENLSVTAPGDIAVYLGCPAAGCSPEAVVEVVDSRLHGSQVGLWADGILVATSGVLLEDNVDSSAIEGYGALVTRGGRLEGNGDRIIGNGGMGLLADGAETTAELLDVEVSENDGPGVWVQGLRGSIGVPSLYVDGATSTIASNAKAGIGSVDTVGIVVGTCIVRDTRPVPWPEGGGNVSQVGDGIALLRGTAEVNLGAEAALSSNDRAQVLVDQGGAGIVVGTAIVDPGAGRYGVVVQNTTGAVDINSTVQTDTPPTLGVDDGTQATP